MSILDQWQDRWDFAVYNEEQRFQTQLVTKRRFFNNIINMPLKRIQNRMLRPDVPTSGFDAAAFSFVDDVFITSGAGQVIRSFAFAYGKNKDFRDVHLTSRALESFGMAAESYDQSPLSLGEEIKAGRGDVMYDLVNHSAEASDLLDQFVHGKLPQSPSNIAKLERHLHALSRVCDEKAAIMKSAQGARPAEKRADETEEKISDYIRDVIRADKITTPREAQILSGFISALLVDAAKPLGTEAYVPQEDVFMQPAEAVKFSAFVAEQLKQRGFGTNISLENEQGLPFADLPEGSLIKEDRNEKGEVTGRRKASEAELIGFANALHTQLRQELGSKVETMLEFVDKNFDSVEQSIARSQEDPTPDAMPIHSVRTQPQQAEKAEKPQKWEEKRSLSPFALLHEADNTVRTGIRHMFRPEARHDINKLFNRALAGVIVSYPVKIFNEAAKSFLRAGHGYDLLKDGIKTGTIKGQLIDRADLKGNLQSNNFRTLTTPLASSLATVMSQELYHLPKGLSLEASKRADSVLNGAINAGQRYAPQVQGRMEALDGPHPALETLLSRPPYKDALGAIMEKPAEQRSEADYVLLGQYYRDLSDICISVAEEALSPYGVGITPEKIDSMDEVVSRVLRQPVQNVPDALVSLAFVESFLSVSSEKVASMEYVDPRQLLIKHQDMHKLSEFIDKQAKAAGLVIASKKKPGKGKPGELLEKNQKTGELEPVSPATLVRFANVVQAELKNYVSLDALLMASKGKNKDEYINPVEKKLFAVKDNERQETPAEEVPESLTAPWQGKVSRKSKGLIGTIRTDIANPEVQHEIRKLHGRTLGESTSSCLSSFFSNSLQHNEGIFSRAGIFSAIYGPIVYPLVYSKGLVWTKEVINETLLRKGAIAAEADISKALMEGAITASGQQDKTLRDRLMAENHVNADLMALQEKDEFQDVPRIAAKPRDLRTDKDNELMQRFVDQAGEKLVASSTRIFGSGTASRSVSERLEQALQKPATNLSDATLALGFLNSVMGDNVETMQALRYMKPEDKVMDRAGLRDLSRFMNDQAKLAGFAVHGVPVKGRNGKDFTILGAEDTLKEGELLQWNNQAKRYERAAPESIIRFANVASAKFRDVSQKRLQNGGAASLAERYQRDAKNEVFSRV